MARKIDPNAPLAPPPKPDAGADDLSILHPDVELTIAGRQLTIREYRFLDGLRARAQGKPLTDDLVAMMGSADIADATAEDYLDLLARHDALTRALMEASIDGADADWIESLSEADGETLMVNWWVVCGRFFVRLALRKLLAQTQQQIARASAGSTSVNGSPAQVTGGPMRSSPATPSVN